MKRIIRSTIAILTLSALMGACGGSSSGGGGFTPPPPPPPPPPPAAAQSAGGLWAAPFTTVTAADVVTSFETVDAGNFTVGTAPYTAAFAGGTAQTVGNTLLYADGSFSWHVSGSATITFATPVSTLSYHRRTVTGGVVATIKFKDAAGNEIGMDDPPNVNTKPPLFSIDTAGEPPLASVDIPVTGGEILGDLLTLG